MLEIHLWHILTAGAGFVATVFGIFAHVGRFRKGFEERVSRMTGISADVENLKKWRESHAGQCKVEHEQIRKEVSVFKEEAIDRFARIETKLDLLLEKK